MTIGLFCIVFLVASAYNHYNYKLNGNDIPISVTEFNEPLETVTPEQQPKAINRHIRLRVRPPARTKRQTPYETPLQTWYQMHQENCMEEWPLVEDDYDLERFKRELQYPPDFYDELTSNFGPYKREISYIRDKRRAQLESVRYWNDEYIRCKKSAPENPNCERFRANINKLLSQVETDLARIRNYLRNHELPPQFREEIPEYLEPPNDIEVNSYRDNGEFGAEMNRYDENSAPFVEDEGRDNYHQSEPIHEDLFSQSYPNKHIHFDYNPNLESMMRQRDDPSNLHRQAAVNAFSDDEDKTVAPLGQSGPTGKC